MIDTVCYTELQQQTKGNDMITRDMTKKFTHLNTIFTIEGVKYVAVLEGSRIHEVAKATGTLVNTYKNEIKMQNELVFKLD